MEYFKAGHEAHEKADLEAAITRYTLAIEAGDLSTTNLVAAFNNRGLAYADRGQGDEAIEDFDIAIQLNPKSALAFYNRGNAYIFEGLHERAVEDYNTVVRLSPNNADAFDNRGRAHFYNGQFAFAELDLARAVELNPDDIYKVVWLYLARSHAGQDGRGELGKNSRRFNLTSWPGQVVTLYLGNATPEEVVVAARDLDPKKDKAQHGEAYFYLGQHALLHGDRAEALRLFKATLATGLKVRRRATPLSRE